MTLSDAEWLAMANRFVLTYQTDLDEPEYFIESRGQEDGSTKWVIKHWSSVLHRRTLLWVYEPQPSSRTKRFIRSTRFDSRDEAYECFLKWKRKHEKRQQK